MHTIQVFGTISCKPILTQKTPSAVPYIEFSVNSQVGQSRLASTNAQHFIKPISFSIRAFGNIAEQIHRQCKCGDMIFIIGEYQHLRGFTRSPNVLRLVPHRWEVGIKSLEQQGLQRPIEPSCERAGDKPSEVNELAPLPESDDHSVPPWEDD